MEKTAEAATPKLGLQRQTEQEQEQPGPTRNLRHCFCFKLLIRSSQFFFFFLFSQTKLRCQHCSKNQFCISQTILKKTCESKKSAQICFHSNDTKIRGLQEENDDRHTRKFSIELFFYFFYFMHIEHSEAIRDKVLFLVSRQGQIHKPIEEK